MGAIQFRRGNEADFNPNKQSPAEPAVCTDSGKILVAISQGNVKQLMTTTEGAAIVEQAKEYRDEAQGFKNDTSALKNETAALKDEAAGYSTTAQGYATDSANSASDSADEALLAKSWAVGETGARPDEASNNAKYWASQAQAAAQGDYIPNADRGVTIATLENGKVPTSQLPTIASDASDITYHETDNVENALDTANTNITELAEASNFAKKNVTTNVFNPTLKSTTYGNINVIRNEDNSFLITTNGQPASQTQFIILGSAIIPKGQSKLLGCPNGGSLSTYRLDFYSTSGHDYGNGFIVNKEAPTNDNIVIIVAGGIVHNLLFKPMLTADVDASYDDFVPYTGDTGSLNGDVAQLQKGWKLIGSVTGANVVTIGSNKYSEFLVFQEYNGRSYGYHICSAQLTESYAQFGTGFYVSSGGNAGGIIEARQNAINQYGFNYNGTSVLTSTTMKVYGKR